jgi:uncharacterized Tic20 family protein
VDAKQRSQWKVDEARSGVYLSGLRAYGRGGFEAAAEKFREAGKLGLRERRLGGLITRALFKAGQRLLFGDLTPARAALTPFRPVQPSELGHERRPDLPLQPRRSRRRNPATSEDRQMALFAHVGGALLGFLVPLIIWLIKKDKSPFVDDQGKEALNFQITVILAHVIGGLTICFTFGLLNMAVYVVNLVFGIIGGVEANKGKVYRYPLTIRFIK